VVFRQFLERQVGGMLVEELTRMTNINQEESRVILPALAMRGLVVFEGMTMHFDVGRKRSISALKQAMAENREIFLVSQKDIMTEEPGKQDLYQYGVVATIKQMLKTQDDVVRVLVQGEYRAKIVSVISERPYFEIEVQPAPLSKRKGASEQEMDAMMRVVKNLYENYALLVPKMSNDVLVDALNQTEPEALFRAVAANTMLKYEDKQELLETNNLYRRLSLLAQMLQKESEVLALEKDIFDQVKDQMDKNQRDYFLREQLKAIQGQLGEGEFMGPADDSTELMEKIAAIKNMPEETRTKLYKECDKLSKMPPNSQEASLIHSYLDVCLELPWDHATKESLDIKKAQKILDRDHYGLKKVKERILELLAVRKLAPDLKGQIICLVGPPGVGKTSIGKSIAEALNREYVRLSLGGVRDESDIRGHRKTYVGAMPGRIINALRQAKSRNPLILLDEIDKMGSDFRGDPSAAMLEVLDSEQNNAFRDHYVEIPFDLSEVLFVTTANDTSTIPAPLLDRMEVIELSSYTREEKFQIAKKYLAPKQIAKNGLTSKDVVFSREGIYQLIDRYTREAGVRKLERATASVCRKVAKMKVDAGEDFKRLTVQKKVLRELLGPEKYSVSTLPDENQVGLVTGLAWTSVGGETLEIEALVLPGTGKIQITGNLGDVMTESAKLAVSYVRSIAKDYGIDPDFYKNTDIHIHAPEGAVPKDGPSAGVTICTALTSALSGIPVKRDVAMTGEISLRGRVLPIGGLKEKSIAAYRAGVTTVVIPEKNEPDLAEFDGVIRDNLTFVPVHTVKQVLEIALDIPGNLGKDEPVPEVVMVKEEKDPDNCDEIRM
jgi:ATP-dependent Lon protease